MGFGKSDQNFGMIASIFTMAMWYTDPEAWELAGTQRACQESAYTIPSPYLNHNRNAL